MPTKSRPLKLAELSAVYRKSSPACCRCHYDAEYLLGVGGLERLICERCLTDVLLDAISYADGRI